MYSCFDVFGEGDGDGVRGAAGSAVVSLRGGEGGNSSMGGRRAGADVVVGSGGMGDMGDGIVGSKLERACTEPFGVKASGGTGGGGEFEGGAGGGDDDRVGVTGRSGGSERFRECDREADRRVPLSEVLLRFILPSSASRSSWRLSSEGREELDAKLKGDETLRIAAPARLP